MVANIEPRVKKILKEYDLKPEHALWELKRGGKATLIMLHKYCELVGAKAGVIIDDIVEVETPITGHYGPYRFNTDINLRDNPSGVDLYPCGWLPYLGGSGYGGGYGVCGA